MSLSYDVNLTINSQNSGENVVFILMPNTRFSNQRIMHQNIR